LLLKNK